MSELEITQARSLFHRNQIEHLPVDFQTQLRKRRTANNNFLKKVRKTLESKKNQNAEHWQALADGLHEQREQLVAANEGKFTDDPAAPSSSSAANFTEDEVHTIVVRGIIEGTKAEKDSVTLGWP